MTRITINVPVLIIALLAAVAAVISAEMPEIIRYLKVKAMDP